MHGRRDKLRDKLRAKGRGKLRGKLRAKLKDSSNSSFILVCSLIPTRSKSRTRYSSYAEGGSPPGASPRPSVEYATGDVRDQDSLPTLVGRAGFRKVHSRLYQRNDSSKYSNLLDRTQLPRNLSVCSVITGRQIRTVIYLHFKVWGTSYSSMRALQVGCCSEKERKSNLQFCHLCWGEVFD